MPSKVRVTLFVTCLVEQVMPEIGIATAQLFARLGIQFAVPKNLTCCGQPFFNSGFLPEALKLAKKTIAALEKSEIVVLPSGSCTAMIRKEYPKLLADEPKWTARAVALAERTLELSEFLAKHDLLSPRPLGGNVTYHDSCHMCRGLGLRAEPRQVLAKAGMGVTEMQESDRCCGFGGLFSMKMPEVASAMRTEKLEQAKDTGAPIMVTADPGCLLHLRLQPDANRSFWVRHLAEVLEEVSR